MSRAPGLLVVRHLERWRSQWDEMVDLSPLPSPFLRSWWLEGTAGPGGVFLLVVDGDRLLGGLALDQGVTFGLPSFHMMGSRGHLCPDHLDLVATPGHEDTTIRVLRAWLRRPGGRLIDLAGVRTGSRLGDALPAPARCRTFAVAPWAPLSTDADTFFEGLPSRFRRTIRRASERLASAGVTHRVRRGPSAVRSLETLRRLHEAQWGNRSAFLPDFDRFASACRRGTEVDEVAVHELATDAEVIATVVAFEVGRRVSLYQSARREDTRWRDATPVLLTAVISDACARGFDEVDFLRGNEPYKARYAQRRREMVRLIAGAGGPARMVSTVTAAAAHARPVLEQWVQEARLAVQRTGS